MMASTILAEISRLDSQDLRTPSASITEVKQQSSYNWIEARTPTIAIPGSPPLWSALKGPQRLKKDSGLIYIAQNAVRHPDFPLEPLFRALYVANPSFDIRAVDVVTDRNNIRKLLSFINPASAKYGLEPFTINVEVAKNTAIFSRQETATQEFIGPHEFRGFGHEFEKAYTTSQISGSTGHHRIVSYRFSDLNFIVRHETDGFVEDGTKTSSSTSKEPDSGNLSGLLESLSLSSTNNTSINTPALSKLTIMKEGKLVPLESNLEIKTRVSHKPLSIQEIAPQLWVSQTFKLVRAYHQKGIFQDPKVEDVEDSIKRWEQRNQVDLRKLAALINKIIKVAKEGGGNAVIKYDEKKDKLIISKFNGKRTLPEDLYSKWEVDDEPEAESKAEKAAGDAPRPVDEVKEKAEGESVVDNSGDTKEEETAEADIERLSKVPDGPPPTSKPAKETDSGLQEKD